jgi:hypothetical protein
MQTTNTSDLYTHYVYSVHSIFLARTYRRARANHKQNYYVCVSTHTPTCPHAHITTYMYTNTCILNNLDPTQACLKKSPFNIAYKFIFYLKNILITLLSSQTHTLTNTPIYNTYLFVMSRPYTLDFVIRTS